MAEFTKREEAKDRRISKLVLANDDKQQKIKRMERELRDSSGRAITAEKRLDIVQKISQSSPRIQGWRSPKSRHKKGSAIPLLMLSDLHLGEVVAPEEIEFSNGFDIGIAEARLKHCFEKAVTFPRDIMSGLKYEGIVCALGGDMLGGSIHPELMKTNAQTDFEAVVYWCPILANGIRLLADEYGKVYVPCVAGNHDRSPANRRTPSKKRAQDSFTWIMYHWLKETFKDDSRVEIHVSTAADLAFPVYDTKFNLTHGDQFKGGNGIGGVAVPIMRGNTRKMSRQASLGVPYDILLMGHFHQFLTLPHVIVNGSLKGYDEYAYTNNFSFERPSQMLLIMSPEHGIVTKTAIHCDLDSEEWKQ